MNASIKDSNYKKLRKVLKNSKQLIFFISISSHSIINCFGFENKLPLCILKA